jgi:hypothetical protein
MAGKSLKAKLIAAGGAALAAAVALSIVLAASGDTVSTTSGFPRGSDPVDLDPADFSANIDNPHWPMTVGSRWVYRVVDTSDGSVQRDVIRVTSRTKMIADGVKARVVSDIVSDHGTPTEVTRDWYAQDSDGNVWYFGENTVEYKHGKPTDNGTWEAGIDGNLPGLALPAAPEVGMSYREEYSKGVAEDQSRVLALDEQAQVPAGHYRDVLMTEDFSPLEPNVSEIKFYAPGSGQAVLAVDASGGSDMEQLVKYTR